MDLAAYTYVYLLMVYPKSEKGTLTNAEIKKLREISKATKEAFQRREVKW